MSNEKINFNDLPCEIKNKIFIMNRSYNCNKNLYTKLTGIIYSCLIDYSNQNDNVFNFDIKKNITKEQYKKYNIKNLIYEKEN